MYLHVRMLEELSFLCISLIIGLSPASDEYNIRVVSRSLLLVIFLNISHRLLTNKSNYIGLTAS